MSKQDFIALADELRRLDVPEAVLEALVRFCRGRNGRWFAQESRAGDAFVLAILCFSGRYWGGNAESKVARGHHFQRFD